MCEKERERASVRRHKVARRKMRREGKGRTTEVIFLPAMYGRLPCPKNYLKWPG